MFRYKVVNETLKGNKNLKENKQIRMNIRGDNKM